MYSRISDAAEDVYFSLARKAFGVHFLPERYFYQLTFESAADGYVSQNKRAIPFESQNIVASFRMRKTHVALREQHLFYAVFDLRLSRNCKIVRNSRSNPANRDYVLLDVYTLGAGQTGVLSRFSKGSVQVGYYFHLYRSVFDGGVCVNHVRFKCKRAVWLDKLVFVSVRKIGVVIEAVERALRVFGKNLYIHPAGYESLSVKRLERSHLRLHVHAENFLYVVLCGKQRVDDELRFVQRYETV